jgi:hypothetical protein
MLAIDPRPFTFGELQGMLEANELAKWDHTASLLACMAGIFKKGVSPLDFHPYRKRFQTKGPRATAGNLRGLKAAFPKWVDPYDSNLGQGHSQNDQRGFETEIQ